MFIYSVLMMIRITSFVVILTEHLLLIVLLTLKSIIIFLNRFLFL